MSEISKVIRKCREQIDSAYATLETDGRLGEALAAYQKVEHRITKLALMPFHAGYRDGQRALAAVLLRQGDVLEKFERLQEAAEVRARQLKAARASGDLLTLAQALVTFGAGLVASAGLVGPEDQKSDRDRGHHALEEARRLYESGESDAHKLGLGDYWLRVSELQLGGGLEGGAAAALEAAEQAVRILKLLDEPDLQERAEAARARAAAEK